VGNGPLPKVHKARGVRPTTTKFGVRCEEVLLLDEVEQAFVMPVFKKLGPCGDDVHLVPLV
jgi:hypothetical protein